MRRQDTSEAKPTLLTVYSGRNENLVGPLLEQFGKDTGIAIQVKYGGTAEIAATILEEGANSPADVFYAQDAGALGALQAENRLAALPDAVLNAVEPRFRSPQGQWVGTSGRARVVVYNTENVKTGGPAPVDLGLYRSSLEGTHWLGADQRLVPGVRHRDARDAWG